MIAFNRFDQINVMGVVSQLVQAGMVITAIQMGGGLISLAWIILGVILVRQLCIFFLAFRCVEYLSLSFRNFDWPMLRTLLTFGSQNVLVGMARRLTNYGGTFVIGVILGPVMVAFYAIAQSLAVKQEDLGKGVTSVLMPVVSRLDAKNRRTDLAKVYFLASRILLALAMAAATVFIAIGRPLIDLWIGPEYGAQSYPVLCLLAIGMGIRMVSLSSTNVLKGIGEMHRLVRVSILEAVLTLVLGTMLVRSFGLMGMGLAVLLSQVVVAGLYVPVITCRAIGVSIMGFARNVLLPGVTAALPGVVLAIAMSEFAPPGHLIQVVVQALSILAVTGITMLFVCFDRRLRCQLFQSILPEPPLSDHRQKTTTE